MKLLTFLFGLVGIGLLAWVLFLFTVPLFRFVTKGLRSDDVEKD